MDNSCTRFTSSNQISTCLIQSDTDFGAPQHHTISRLYLGNIYWLSKSTRQKNSWLMVMMGGQSATRSVWHDWKPNVFLSGFQYLNRILMHGSILPVTIPPPPGNPGDRSSPSVPGVGNCLKPSCPGGRGAGQIENNFLLFLWSTSLLGWPRTAWRRLPISRENL